MANLLNRGRPWQDIFRLRVVQKEIRIRGPDPTPLDKYTLIIIGTAIAFFALAAALLVPIWRFLNSEQKRAEEWTEEALRRRRKEGGEVPRDAGVSPVNGSELDDHQRS